MAGVLDGALLRAEIDVSQSETLRIAFSPFEIVEQAPVMIGERWRREAWRGRAREDSRA
jgi:hypothetical protein